MNRFVLSSSFASLGFLPLIFQTPTAQEAVVDIAVEPAVVAELVSPATQEPTAATPENEIEAVLGKLEWVLEAVPTAETAIEAVPAEGWILEAVPTEERGVLLDVTPVESAGGMIELHIAPTPADDENAQLRKRVKELEARMAELMGHQENNQTGRWRTGKVEEIHGRVAPHAGGQNGPIRVRLHDGPDNHRVIDRNGDFFELHGTEGTHKFPGGKVVVHSGSGTTDNEDHNVRIWVTDDDDEQYSFFSDKREFSFGDGAEGFFHHEDTGDEECGDDCDEGRSGTHFITIGSGACELGDIDLEELGIDLSDLDLGQLGLNFENVNFDELDLNLEDLGINLENFQINVNGQDIDIDFEGMDFDMEDFDIDLEDIDFEALGINFEDLDIDIEELIEEGALDDHEVIVRVGIASDGAHNHQHARQSSPHVVRKRVVRSSAPQVARVRGLQQHMSVVREPRAPRAAREPRAPRDAREPRAPRAPHAVSVHRTIRPHAASPSNRTPHKAHDVQEEWTDILEEMHDELRELRGVISDLSNELRELSESKGRGTRRGSMR